MLPSQTGLLRRAQDRCQGAQYRFLEGASTFKIRFRIETDSSVTKDGWSIDNIRFITPKS